jgi:hypothetical protein
MVQSQPMTISRSAILRRLLASGNRALIDFYLPTSDHLRPDTTLRVFSFAPVGAALLPIPVPVDELRVEAVEDGKVIFADPWQDNITPRPEPLPVKEILADDVRPTEEGVITLLLIRL